MRRLSLLCVMMCAIVCSGPAHAEENGHSRCGTTDRFVHPFTPGVNGKIMEEPIRPVLQKSVLSPSKKFRIHFDTTGVNLPALVTPDGVRVPGTMMAFVDSVARTFDSVWQCEVAALGFPAPPTDQGRGGGNEFDIYILQLDPGYYGAAKWDDAERLSGTFAVPHFSAVIHVSNDFSSVPTKGIPGLKVTAAHEFFHAIQIGCYGAWDDSGEWYFYELTAEAMEPTVYPSIKDYIKDIQFYFNSIGTYRLYQPLTDPDRGYDRAIWGLFLMKRFGVKIMRELWESVSTMKPMAAMKSVLEKNGSSLEREFSEFCYWNYFTGWRADSTRYYPDARLFPMVDIHESRELSLSPLSFQPPTYGFCANYLQATHLSDTATLIVANVNVNEALTSGKNPFGFNASVSLSPFDGSMLLSNGWSAKLTVSDPQNWKFTSITSLTPAANTASICYPNPYHPTESPLYIGFNPLSLGLQPPQLSVYTASMHRVFFGKVSVETFTGGSYAVWDGRTSRGDLLPSGVYIYSLLAGETLFKGKFAVIR